MAIAVTCSTCGKQSRAKDEYAGKLVKCSGCQGVLIIPTHAVLPTAQDLPAVEQTAHLESPPKASVATTNPATPTNECLQEDPAFSTLEGVPDHTGACTEEHGNDSFAGHSTADIDTPNGEEEHPQDRDSTQSSALVLEHELSTAERPRPRRVHFTCPWCQHTSWAREEDAGKKGKCSACGRVLVIPLKSGQATKPGAAQSSKRHKCRCAECGCPLSSKADVVEEKGRFLCKRCSAKESEDDSESSGSKKAFVFAGVGTGSRFSRRAIYVWQSVLVGVIQLLGSIGSILWVLWVAYIVIADPYSFNHFVPRTGLYVANIARIYAVFWRVGYQCGRHFSLHQPLMRP